MTPTSSDLLKLLDSGMTAARSVSRGLVSPGAQPAGAVELPAFADLLSKAQRGELNSGLPVNVDSAAGVSLDAGQLARLSRAADAAEAAGMHTAVVLIDGMSLELNVHTRTITRGLDLSSAAVTGIDGIIPAPAAGDTPAPSTGLIKLPGTGLASNASLASLLGVLNRSLPTATAPVTPAA